MPATFERKVPAGSSAAGPTRVCAARWKTESAPAVARSTDCLVRDVPFDQFDLAGDPVKFEGTSRSAGQVQHDDFVAAVEQRLDQVPADEPLAAGD